MKNGELIEGDFQKAQMLYSTLSPSYIGRLTLNPELLKQPEIDFNLVTDKVVSTLNDDPFKSMSFCRTFGKLGIYLALDDQPTSFVIDPVDKYPKGSVAELATTREFKPSELLRYKNGDGPLSIVVFDQPTQSEMAIIQALHMFDAAVITQLAKPGEIPRPLLFTADQDSILKLRADNSNCLLRQYGNVRNRDNAPTLLGIALPTTALEGNLDIKELSSMQSFPGIESKPKKVFIGITTTKKPHIGHGFLLTKALGETGENGQVIVELNDQGPRVAAMIERLAADGEKSFNDIADSITYGEIGPIAIEEAYKSREDQPTYELPDGFALTLPNIDYKRLLNKVQPRANSIVGISDSEVSTVLIPALENKREYMPLLGSCDGAGILRGINKSVLIKTKGKPTVAGLISALALQGELTVVDSPPPLSKSQVAVFAECGIAIKLEAGMGISINFDVASGTKGNSLGFNELFNAIESNGLEMKQFALILRDMLENAYFILGDGNSLNPNFYNLESVKQKLQASIENIKSGRYGGDEIFKPIRLKNISSAIAASILGTIDMAKVGQPTVKVYKNFAALFPSLYTTFSTGLKDALNKIDEGVIPKNLLTENDRKLLQMLSQAKSEFVFSMCEQNYADKPEIFQEKFGATLAVTVAKGMGYTVQEYPIFLNNLAMTKGIYATI